MYSEIHFLAKWPRGRYSWRHEIRDPANPKAEGDRGRLALPEAHAFREQPTPNADPDKAAKNEHVGAASAAEAMQKVRDRLPETAQGRGAGHQYLITASPEAMQGMGARARPTSTMHSSGCGSATAGPTWSMQGCTGTSTPHMYAYVVPLDESTGRLNARRWLGVSRP